jgi:hypothetical protein
MGVKTDRMMPMMFWLVSMRRYEYVS